MNFQPNFEQYKIDQNNLEKIPTIKPEFHFTVNDVAHKILQHQEVPQKEIDDLEMVYSATQDIEQVLVTCLDQYRSKEIITKAEFLVAVTYFLLAHQNGPDSSELKNEMIDRRISTQEFIQLAEKISIPEHTRTVLIEVYRKSTD